MGGVLLMSEVTLSPLKRTQFDQLCRCREFHLSPFGGGLRSPPRALPAESKVESGMFQSKSGASINSSNSGDRAGQRGDGCADCDDADRCGLVWVLT